MQDSYVAEDTSTHELLSKPLIFSQYVPDEPLSQFVDLFWYWQEVDLLRGKECVLPTGSVELVINLDSGRTADSVISGVKSKPTIIANLDRSDDMGHLLGIHFKPGGAFPFLPFPFQDLHNNNITLGDLWGEQKASQLLSLLHEKCTVSEQFIVLERWLIMHMINPLQHQPAVSLASSELQRDPNLSITNLCEKVNLSQRHFIQVFQNEMGLKPKLFSRIQRFQRVLEFIEVSNTIYWFDVAATCGYFDQSHFIHEFQKFSGITPTTYLDIRTEHRNHIPLIN